MSDVAQLAGRVRMLGLHIQDRVAEVRTARTAEERDHQLDEIERILGALLRAADAADPPADE